MTESVDADPAAAGRSKRRLDLALALMLALGTVGWMLAVEGRQGIGRDESLYLRAGERYWGWFSALADNIKAKRPLDSFRKAGVDAYFSENPEHPPLMKVLYGVSWRWLHECKPGRTSHPYPPGGVHRTLPLFRRESTAFRFPAILMAGLGAALAFVFARRFVGPAASVAAAIMAVAQPHYFFHAQIACFDAPITTLALLVAYAYWRSLRSARWGILCGIFWGLALATKHNAWLMPAFLLAHYLWMRRRDFLRLRPPRVPLAFIAMVTLGPAVAYALWPYMWPDALVRAKAYFLRHMQHEHYNFEYLGQNWNFPPTDADLKMLRITFPFVSTLLTVPVTTLCLALAGAFTLWRRANGGNVIAAPPATDSKASWLRPGADVDNAPGVFFAMQILGPMAVVALPSTPIFGGVKHFMPAMPFLAIVAGIGVQRLVLSLAPFIHRPAMTRALPAAIAAIVCLPSIAETRRSHPDGLSHYNLLAGGFAGGASLGMNRQFWGYSVLPMLDGLLQSPPPSHALYWHDVMPDALTWYVRDRRISAFPGYSGVGEDAIVRSDSGIIIHERHMTVYEGVFWESYGTTRPVAVREREGVPLVTAYRRAGAPGP